MAAIGYVFLVCFLGYVLSFGVRLLLRFLRKEPLLGSGKWWVRELIDGGAILFCGLLFGVIIAFAFQTYDLYNIILYATAVFLTALLLKPTRIAAWVLHGRLKEKKVIASLTLKGAFLLTLLLETFAFNGKAYVDGTSPLSYSLTDDEVSVASDLELTADGSAFFGYEDSYKTMTSSESNPCHCLSFVPDEGASRRITLEFDDPESVEIYVYVLSYREGELVAEKTYSMNPLKASSCIMTLSEDYDELRISLCPAWGRFPYGEGSLSEYGVYVSGIIINPSVPFDFAYLRFFALSFAFLSVYEMFARLDKKARGKSRQAEALEEMQRESENVVCGTPDAEAVNANKGCFAGEKAKLGEESVVKPSSLWKNSVFIDEEDEASLKRLAKIPLIRRYQIAIGALTLLGLLTAIIAMFFDSSSFFSSYPLVNNVERYDIFTQLFDALHKGRLSLDVSESLTLWDHAYYEGNCYCYYGILPVLLVSFPIYFFTGYVPNALALQIIGYVLMTGAFLLVLLEILGVFLKNPDWKTVLFILIVSLLLSLSLMNISFKSYYIGSNPNNPCVEAIYHIPYNYGLACFDLFLWMAILGYRSEKKRPLYFALSGLFFVFMLLARPNLVLTIILVCPLFLKPLFKKPFRVKETLLSYGPMFLILAIGAFFICKYNYDRFDSIFEFGQRYQNTISDQTGMSLKAETLFPSFFHFFLNPISFQSSFPYVIPTNPQITSVSGDYSYYLNYYAGILSVPLFAFALISFPFAIRLSSDKTWRAIGYLLWPTLILMAWMTYSYAGLCPRYMIEPYHIAALFAFIPVILLLSRYEKSANALVPALMAVIFVSLFVAWNLSRTTFDGLNGGDLNGYRYDIQRFFTVN